MKKILVTGAAGFIGMHTSIKFIEGFEVIGIDNLNDYYSTEFKMMRLKEIKKISNKLNSKWTLEADISNDSIWNNLKKYNIDRVVHYCTSRWYSIENPNAYINSQYYRFSESFGFLCQVKY